MKFEPSLLSYFLRDAMIRYSEDFRIVDKQNPTEFRLNGNQYSVYISYIHDSGENRPNEDEARIQISRSQIELQRTRTNAGKHVAFIGFFRDGEYFVGWEPQYIFSLKAKTVVSVYARLSQKLAAEKNESSVHTFPVKYLGRRSFALALPSNALGIYLENVNQFHNLTDVESIRFVFEDRENMKSDLGLGTKGQFNIKDAGRRRKFSYNRKAYPRDPKFSKNTLLAYDYSCCVCQRQMGLVEAAHIIPHAEEDSPSTVTNGLALCVEHHKLYDDALLLPAPGRVLFFNEERAKFLCAMNRHKGLEYVRALHGSSIRIPSMSECEPSNEFLKRGLEIRLAQKIE